MTTTFKGNRVKKAKTPLMEESAMYLNIVNSGTGGGEAITSRSQQEGYYAPIVRTLIDNGVTNAYIDYGKSYKQITTKKLEATDTDYFTITSPKNNRYLITEAIEPLRKMLNDWGKWMESNGFKSNNGKYITITSMYRDFATQQGLSGQKTAAAAGTSYHGWALAVDMKCVKKNGEYVSINAKDGSSPDDFKFTGENATNPALKWLYDNSYKYGFLNPLKLRDNNSYDEYWHWEYHGTSAKCIVSKNPTVYGQKIDVSGAVNSFVKNPKNPDGTEAVYTDCTYQYVKTGDGIEGGGETVLGSSADFWSLVAICSLEAGIGQARADVAQSIYNRLATPGKRYGKSIKEIIVEPGQYDPTKNSISKWQAIKDEKTAIEAIKASKGFDENRAKKAINDTISALNNSDYQLKSRQFIETRTEFLGYYPTSKYAKNVVHRKTPSDNSKNGGNNYFYWEYAGKELIGKTPPNPPNLSQYS
jgi:LAS superfamily LD-carboxypeptidase LdcB